MENNEESPLASMRGCAQMIDDGLKKIERSFSSVESLMPSTEHTERAEKLMLDVLEESKQLEEVTAFCKTKLSRSVEAIKSEHEKTTNTLEYMEAELNRMEDMLEKFGYVRFQMPEENTPLEEELSNLTENLDITSDYSNIEMEEDLTPFITKKRASRSSGKNSQQKNEVSTPGSNGLGVKKIVFEPSPVIDSAAMKPSNITEGVTSTAKKIREKPKMPILSKITYDLLGMNPPSDFDRGDV